MQIGIDGFVAAVPDTLSGENLGPADRLSHLLSEIQSADRVGLDVFGIGEHHRAEFLDSAPETILDAAAVRTERIRLTSAVTVLSANDPIRIFQQFATIDLLSHGRAEVIVRRGSFVEAFPLFGLDLADYDSLFVSKLELLLKIRDNSHVHWAVNTERLLRGKQFTRGHISESFRPGPGWEARRLRLPLPRGGPSRRSSFGRVEGRNSRAGLCSGYRSANRG